MDSRRRMLLYRQMHQWHWISAAVCLAALLLFSVTGITLNHATAISAQPQITKREAQMPQPARDTLAPVQEGALPAPVIGWLESEFSVDLDAAAPEWSPEEVYVSLPGPGRDAWLSVDRASGKVAFEATDRGAISYLNDLHKGRNTGTVWKWFIDIVAVACLIFSATGLVLLVLQAKQRRATWPLVTTGIGLVVVLMVFFAH